LKDEFNEKSLLRLIEIFGDKQLALYMHECFLSIERLLSLNPGTELQIIGEVGWSADDALLKRLTLNKFRLLRVPVVLESADTILKVIEIVSASDVPQEVVVKIPEAPFFSFLTLLGLREEGLSVSKLPMCEFRVEKHPKIPRDYTLFYKNATIRVNHRKEEDQTLISLIIENSAVFGG
ncbi:hypothetical protein PFISCL1PPCAC_12710, partial [Pristionchus fissidentatus]